MRLPAFAAIARETSKGARSAVIGADGLEPSTSECWSQPAMGKQRAGHPMDNGT